MKNVVDFCGDLLAQMRLELTAEGIERNGEFCINITGPDRPYLLSNTASLLNNIEYLLNRVFPGNRKDAGISLDSDNYRHHRELELRLLAQMASQKVLASGKPLTLQAMIPQERKIVHTALSEINGVTSRSDGDGEERSVTIYLV